MVLKNNHNLMLITFLSCVFSGFAGGGRMRWGLGGRTPEFSVWVFVLGVLTVTVIGQQQHIGGKQQQRQQQQKQQQQQQSHPQHLGDPQQQSSSSLASGNNNNDNVNHLQQQTHSSQKSTSSRDYRQSDESIKILEASLLKMFGMRSRPKPRKNIHIPQYILDLYKQHNRDSEDISFNFKVRGTATHSANTIRSFYHKGEFDISQTFLRRSSG